MSEILIPLIPAVPLIFALWCHRGLKEHWRGNPRYYAAGVMMGVTLAYEGCFVIICTLLIPWPVPSFLATVLMTLLAVISMLICYQEVSKYL